MKIIVELPDGSRVDDQCAFCMCGDFDAVSTSDSKGPAVGNVEFCCVMCEAPRRMCFVDRPAAEGAEVVLVVG